MAITEAARESAANQRKAPRLDCGTLNSHTSGGTHSHASSAQMPNTAHSEKNNTASAGATSPPAGNGAAPTSCPNRVGLAAYELTNSPARTITATTRPTKRATTLRAECLVCIQYSFLVSQNCTPDTSDCSGSRIETLRAPAWRNSRSQAASLAWH